MKTRCDDCHQSYDVDDEYLGQEVECPQCGGTFVVKAYEPTRIPFDADYQPKRNSLPNLKIDELVKKFGRRIVVCIICCVVLLFVWLSEREIRNWWNERQEQKRLQEEQIRLREAQAQAEQEAREIRLREERARIEAVARAEREAREQRLREERELREMQQKEEEKQEKERKKLEEQKRKEAERLAAEELRNQEIAAREKRKTIQLYSRQLDATESYIQWLIYGAERNAYGRPRSSQIRMADLPPIFCNQIPIISKQDRKLEEAIRQLEKTKESFSRVPQRRQSPFGLDSFRLGHSDAVDVKRMSQRVKAIELKCRNLRKQALKEIVRVLHETKWPDESVALRAEKLARDAQNGYLHLQL